MTAAENKRLLQNIFAELAKGNSTPYVEAMADDFTWVMPGSTAWSKTYAGKNVVVGELFAALRGAMEGRIKTIAHRDVVAVEARGDNMTKAGRPYRNTYCMVFRLAGGKLKELTKYMDTELVTAVLGDPPASAASS